MQNWDRNICVIDHNKYMAKNILFLIFILLLIGKLFSQESFEKERLRSISQMCLEEDIGVTIRKSDEVMVFNEYYSDIIVEKVFENNYGCKIFYTGAE